MTTLFKREPFLDVEIHIGTCDDDGYPVSIHTGDGHHFKGEGPVEDIFPWELLHGEQTWLAAGDDTPSSIHLETGHPLGDPVDERPC